MKVDVLRLSPGTKSRIVNGILNAKIAMLYEKET